MITETTFSDRWQIDSPLLPRGFAIALRAFGGRRVVGNSLAGWQGYLNQKGGKEYAAKAFRCIN